MMLLVDIILLSVTTASSCGHSEVVKLLLTNGADTSLKDIDNNDPISVANDDITRSAFQSHPKS